MDLLSLAFLFCFAFGLAFVLVSFLAGHIGHGAEVGGLALEGADLAAGHHAAGEHGAGGHSPPVAKSWLSSLHLSPSSAAVFLVWFGGVGYAVHSLLGLGAALGLLIGSLAGLIGGALVTLFLVRLLIPGQTFLGSSDVVGVGTVARVSRDIRPGGIGEIVYVLGGTRHSDGARAHDPTQPIPRGTEVVITRIERGIAYVQPWNAYLAESERRKE